VPTKSWSTLVGDFQGTKRDSIFASWTNYRTQFVATGSMVSVSHKMPITGQGDQGGPFLLEKTEYEFTPKTVNSSLVRGQVVPNSNQPNMPSGVLSSKPSDASLDAAGTTAIARCEPTNPAFSAATFIGEAREGAPSLVGIQTWRNKTKVARSAGSEYLNVEFGWKPLVRDIQNFAHAVNNSDQILRDYHAGSAKKTRTGYSFPKTVTTKSYTGGGILYAPSNSNGLSTSGTIINQTTDEQWFEGAFRYHLPVGDSQIDKFRRWGSDARHLLGLEITPEVVWNISPWTWAVDWFSNTGDVLHNISALGRDGLVMQYGYIMSKSVNERTIYTNGGAMTKVTQTRLMRRPATPFGFGVNLSALTNAQTAILVALGLSRH